MFFKKKTKVPEYISEAIDYLEIIDQDWLMNFSRAYEVLSYDDDHKIMLLGIYASQYLSTLNISKIMKLGENFKTRTSIEWSIDWKNIDIKKYEQYFIDTQDYIWLLIFGTFHPNGYFREKCMRNLSNYNHTLPYFLLRMNDWVEPIQSLAYEIITQKLEICTDQEIMDSLFVYEKIKKSGRRNNIEFHIVEDKILSRLQNIRISQDILKLDIHNRKVFYRIMTSLTFIDFDAVYELINQEKDTYCQLMMIRNILQSEKMNLDILKPYLHHKSSIIRKEALLCRYRLEGLWEHIEEDLLDHNYAIRDFIRFVIRKHTDFDILDYYSHHLNCPIGILGVGECQGIEYISNIQKCLTSKDEKIVRASLRSLSLLMKEKGRDIYYKYLFDERIAVSKVSYKAILNHQIHYGAKRIYEEYKKCDVLHLQYYLLHILMHENSWERLPYLLKLYHIEDKNMQNKIQQAVQQRNSYQKISIELKDQIIDEMNRNVIPENLKQEILFDLKYVCKEK